MEDFDRMRFACGKPLPAPLRLGWRSSGRMKIMNDDGIRQQLEMLKVEHRDLDTAIAALQSQAIADQLQIARLKRKKLGLKDRIRLMEDQLVPDIIA